MRLDEIASSVVAPVVAALLHNNVVQEISLYYQGEADNGKAAAVGRDEDGSFFAKKSS